MKISISLSIYLLFLISLLKISPSSSKENEKVNNNGIRPLRKSKKITNTFEGMETKPEPFSDIELEKESFETVAIKVSIRRISSVSIAC